MSDTPTTVAEAKPDLPVSITRTVVPFLVGWVATLLIRRFGVTIDNDVIASLLTLVIGSVYYALVRFVERHKRVAGWLLGYAARPRYIKIENGV